MEVIAFVPVRGGSKSISLKNIKPFCGRPLIYWNLRALNDAKEVDTIVVATDSDVIEDCVHSLAIPKVVIYRRKDENAKDTSSTEDVMLEFIESGTLTMEDDQLFILSQVTNPFTSSEDVTAAIQQVRNDGSDSLLTCSRIRRFFWNEDGIPLNYDYLQRPRRQDFKGTLIENGAFYINRVGNIRKGKNRLSGKIAIYEMPEYTQFEMDEIHDWVIAEHLFKVMLPDNYSLALEDKIQKIKIILSDVDGVLTDAGMYYSERGDELKKFNTRDGKGFELLQDSGYKTGMITSESTQIVSNRGKKLKLDYICQGESHMGKINVIKEICAKEGYGLDEVAYIGDDINCLESLSAVGLAACPSDAEELVKGIPGITVLSLKGGSGVLREFANLILQHQ